MLEKYFVRPETADRIRCSWIAHTVEQYVTWLSARRYSQCSVKRRPVAVQSHVCDGQAIAAFSRHDWASSWRPIARRAQLRGG